MKSILLLFVFICSSQLSFGQFEITEDSVSVSVDVKSEYNASFTYPIAFTDSIGGEYQWTATWDAPDEWQSQLCLNPIKCYGYDDPGTSEDFEPGIEYEFVLKVFHNNVCGDGVYTLRLLTMDGEIIEEVVSSPTFINCAVTPTSETELVEFKASPNPTQGNFTLQTTDNYKSITVISVMGQVMKTFSAQESYDISDLSSGTYFIRIIDSNNNSHTQRIIKR